MDSNKQIKYIPLNASETAVLHDTNTILPRDEIYKPLVELIRQACNRAKEAISNSKSLDALRAHNAISIDGERGTGKTAVLVNLRRYLELEHKDLLADVHILNPIDPTLLEDGESLFLHIIVAAVLHDEEIKQAQRNKPEQSRTLNNALNQLANSLEAVDTQQTRHGIDKVRAMYGNKKLADCVHDFFFVATQLLGKKILILPIDDVDTSLNLAFENLEIIRRYLTTPYVLPIVSGDRDLYHEVTWRDFHGRLIKDSTYHRQDAYITATELAEEYQRKVLPFPRRQTMPDVSRYWQWNYDRKNSDGKGVILGNPSDGMPLANFITWLEIYLTGPVNGKENSRLPLPIPSIRALTQLVNHCSDFIPALPSAICNANSELAVKRMWQMPTVPLSAIDAFQAKYHELRQQRKREYTDAYKLFADKMQSEPHTNHLENNSKKALPQYLSKKLAGYFRFEPKAGAIYLVLLAKQHWENRITSDLSGIFDTPLFQPLVHNLGSLNSFDKHYDLVAWVNPLTKRLPEEWLSGLKSQKTILPYPIAEVGINSSKRWNYAKEISELELNGLDIDKKNKATFFITLQEEHNFYTNAKQSMLLNIGRIFELIISSIVSPVSIEDIYSILNRAPFFSTAALAPTKTLQLEEENAENLQEEQEHTNSETEEAPQLALIIQLLADIKEWRKHHNLDLINISPWLVYKVFNKVYSQVASSEKVPNGMKHIGTAINRVAHIFYSTWFAFGSFEKGELFGLPNVVSTTNINPENLKHVENSDNFNINVRPFFSNRQEITNKQTTSLKNRSPFGKETRAISYFLADHPLKTWIDELIAINWHKPITSGKETKAPTNKVVDAKSKYPEKVWLCEKLNIAVPTALRTPAIVRALENWSLEKCLKLLDEIIEMFPNKLNSPTIKNLKEAIAQKAESL
ncbi:antiviral RADAR system adenosine triphosphatase RdrA [Plesiomonas shigelloides]|uniref:antiviral RADAR system adenosine triphosphatase RdrA n=1 Tax=Plesiomonas shigelloides TaxID=703 RepID=UPI00387EF698